MKEEQNEDFLGFVDYENLAIEHFLQKYEALVWYARKNPKMLENNKVAFAHYIMTESKYQEEVDLLRGEDSDWQHGFNSGCLATIRAVEHPFGFRKGMEDFPWLDT